MDCREEQSESMSPKAAAFSIASLLTKDAKENSNTTRDFWSKASSLHPFAVDRETRGDAAPGWKSNQGMYKGERRELTRQNGEEYSIKNILGKSDSYDGKRKDVARNAAGRSTSMLDPLQQFAACCDFVRNLDSFKGCASHSTPQTTEVQVAVQQSDLWWKFYACGTEMVITRTGRRMFPTLALSFLGMDPRRYYSVHVDVVPVDGYAYTFVNNLWQVNGMASEMHPLPYIQSYQADEVAHTGLYWMKNGVDFKKVRLTNRRVGPFKDGELHLSPNRKYQPRIHVVEETEDAVKISCSTYVFPETTFIAVTTYQNEELIQMKIDHNPFAKGFRDKGTRRRYIPYEQKAEVPEGSALQGICFSQTRTAESAQVPLPVHLTLTEVSDY